MIQCIYSGSRRRYILPESHNELTDRQLIRLASLLLSGVHIDAAILQALRILLNMSKLRFALLRPEIKERLIDYCQWAISENGLTSQLIPSFRRSLLEKKLYGPTSALDNLRLKEFHACEVRYRMMIDGNDDALDELIAVLYRPADKGYDFKRDPNGDCREPYNANTIAYRSRQIKCWPLAVKHAILMFYDGCRQQLVSDYPRVFSGTEGDADNKADFRGMLMMIRGLASDGKYGTVDEVEDLYLVTALSEIELLLLEQDELLEKTGQP